MTDNKLIELTSALVEKVKSSGYKQIVVSECGARPLAFILENMLPDVNFTYVKFPREPMENIEPLIRFYLKDREINEDILQTCKSGTVIEPKRPSLETTLKGIGTSSQNEFQKQVSRSLQHTKLSKTLSQPCLYLDEYIDSGTTLQNADMYFNYFTSNLNFKTLS